MNKFRDVRVLIYEFCGTFVLVCLCERGFDTRVYPIFHAIISNRIEFPDAKKKSSVHRIKEDWTEDTLFIALNLCIHSILLIHSYIRWKCCLRFTFPKVRDVSELSLKNFFAKPIYLPKSFDVQVPH